MERLKLYLFLDILLSVMGGVLVVGTLVLSLISSATMLILALSLGVLLALLLCGSTMLAMDMALEAQQRLKSASLPQLSVPQAQPQPSPAFS